MLTQTVKVRLGLVSIASVLVSLVCIQPGHSQGIGGRPPIGPPGGISGGISGRPPGFSGIGGAGISGRPPGFSGIGGIPDPGFGGIRGIPEPPTMPGMPGNISGRPPGFSGIGGGIDIGPRFITVWSCSNCRRELGRGDFPPSVNTCPHCGVRLIGGGIGSSQIPPPAMPGGIGGGVATPPPPPPVVPIAPGVGPGGDFGGNGVGGVNPPPEMNPPPFAGNGTGVTTTPSTTTTPTKSGSRIATIIGITLGSLLFLGIGVTIVVMAWPKNPKPTQRRRTRRYDDDD